MGILNRTKDQSEQREILAANYQTVATGVTLALAVVPYACSVVGAQIAVVGVSGSPQYALAVNRFIAGSGFTTWVLTTGASNIPAAYGTSGAGVFGTSAFGQSGMLLTNAVGSTLNQLMPNDLLTVTSGGTNAAVVFASLGVVVQPIQDVRVRYNLF